MSPEVEVSAFRDAQHFVGPKPSGDRVGKALTTVEELPKQAARRLLHGSQILRS